MAPAVPNAQRRLTSLKQYDGVTRDEYLRSRDVSDAALHMMNLGSTPVARFRSFLEVLHELAVNRELRRRAGTDEERLLKIDGGNDRLPNAFADRLRNRISYRCAARGSDRIGSKKKETRRVKSTKWSKA